MNDKVKTLNIDGIEVQTSLTPVELASLSQKYAELQSNWNSLREWLETDEQKYFTFQPRQNGKTLQAGIKVGLDMVLDKMNELEGEKDNGTMD